jgi:uncharacterized membrane protein YedE/YeeE
MSRRARPAWLVGVLSGATFAVGLALSGMTDPNKVLGFLDVAGNWDPSLAFVMVGAIGFHFAWLRLTARNAPSASEPAQPNRRIDARLLVGAALFGVGWGMSGYCPGPALVSASFGRPEALLFVLALLGGIAAFRVFDRRPEPELLPAR